MKKLFMCDGEFFGSKMEAKAHRNILEKQLCMCQVSIGPDHWKYGLKGNPRTHSHNAKSGGPGTGFPRSTRR